MASVRRSHQTLPGERAALPYQTTFHLTSEPADPGRSPYRSGAQLPRSAHSGALQSQSFDSALSLMNPKLSTNYPERSSLWIRSAAPCWHPRRGTPLGIMGLLPPLALVHALIVAM